MPIKQPIAMPAQRPWEQNGGGGGEEGDRGCGLICKAV